MSGDEVQTFFKQHAEPHAKKANRMRTRPKTRPSLLATNTRRLMETVDGCQACDLIAAFVPGWECGMWPVDVHHRRRQGPGRSKGGGHMLANLRVVCRKAHIEFIHDIKHQDMARTLGLLVLPDDSEFDSLALVKEQT